MCTYNIHVYYTYIQYYIIIEIDAKPHFIESIILTVLMNK